MTTTKSISIAHLDSAQILQGLDKLVKSERKLMHTILTYIHEVEVRKLHLDIGYDSIFKFLTVHHGYSEDAAYVRMHGARLLAKVPELHEKLEIGSITLTQVSHVCSALRAEKKSGKEPTKKQTLQLLEKIENQSVLATRKIIAVELDQPVVEAQSVRPQKDESFLIHVTLNKTQFEAFLKARSLISHSVTDNSIADAIEHLSNFLIKKIEGTTYASANKASAAKVKKHEVSSKEVGSTDGSSNDVGSNGLHLNKLAAHKVSSNHVHSIELAANEDDSNEAHSNKLASDKLAANEVNSHKLERGEINQQNLSRTKTGFAANCADEQESKTGASTSPHAPVHPARNSTKNATQSFRVIRRRRKHISVSVRRQLMAEAKGQCCFEHPESGFRCDSRYQLQADHILPISEGGSDDISNLRMMCGIHNRDRNRQRTRDSVRGRSHERA